MAGWIPYRLLPCANGSLNIRWLFVGDHSFTEPFFGDSISICLSHPKNISGSFPVTSAETMMRIAEQIECVQPTGFIYHISRCGSTLVSQLLSCDPNNIVLSEVPLLDDILRLPVPLGKGPDREQLYKAVLRLLTRRRNKHENRVFVKTDSWHVLFYEELRTWYPEVSTFLMYRSPREVAASQAKHPAMHSVAGVIAASLFGLTEGEAANMLRSSYLDHVLSCYLRAYSDIIKSNPNAVALSYDEGAIAMTEKIFRSCNFMPGQEILAAMRKRAGFHSKNPEKNFSGDIFVSSELEDAMTAEQLYVELKQVIGHRQLLSYEP